MINYCKFVEKYSNKIKINENLENYHTFRIKGDADIIAEPKNTQELIDMVNVCKENSYKYSILGRGSNTLFKNGEYRGILIVTRGIKDININENILICSCGATLPMVAKVALDNSLSGLEGLSGIPGTIGGAVLMNAGAFGTEMKDLLVSVTVCDKDGTIKRINPSDLELSYRHSNVKEKEYIVLECEIKLKKAKQDDIKATTENFKNRRLSSQPYEYPSSGSIFKRQGEYIAGKLIDECGLKGYSIGGAMVSPKHANFIINTGNATFEDVKSLIDFIQSSIYKKDKVSLNTEVIML